MKRQRMVAGGSRRHDRHCLVQLKIATDASRLLGFAIYVWTIPAQVVQIDNASRRPKHPGVSSGGSMQRKPPQALNALPSPSATSSPKVPAQVCWFPVAVDTDQCADSKVDHHGEK